MEVPSARAAGRAAPGAGLEALGTPPGPTEASPQRGVTPEPEPPLEEWRFPQFDFGAPPRPVWGARQEFAYRAQNFLRGCKWAPDGSCLLSCSDDNVLRIFDLPSPPAPRPGLPLPELAPALRLPEGDSIYDFTWFPLMDSSQPHTCLVASSSRDNPVHLWDAFDGSLRGSFRAYTHLEQLLAPHSLTFSPDGCHLLAGCDGELRIFHTQRPGRQCQQRQLRGGGQGQRGLIGCLAVSPSQSVLAAGSYGRSLGLYPLQGGGALAFWPHLPASPTHLRFSPDGNLLYAGGRKDTHIRCWDLRRPERPLLAMERKVTTNQRLTFDLDPSGRFLMAGDTEGFLSVWDTLSPPGPGDPPLLPPTLRFQALHDCLNGTSLHPGLPLLATASGQRLFPIPWAGDSDSDDQEGAEQQRPPPGGDNRLQLWWWGSGSWPGDTWTMDTEWHPPEDSGAGGTECHPPGDTWTMDTEWHPPGDTWTSDAHCHHPEDTGVGATNCHLPEDPSCHLLLALEQVEPSP